MSIREKLLGRTGAEIVVEGENGAEGSVVVTKKGRTAKIGYLSVKPSSRGKGLGNKLIGVAENWAKQKGIEEIGGTLIPTPGSEETIKHLMKKNGYEIDDRGNIKKKLS